MKVNLNSIGQRVVNPTGVEYTIVELKEDSVIVEGAKGIKELKLSTVEKTFKIVKESKEEAKTLVEEALEEAGLSSKLGKIGEKVEEAKEEEKEIVKKIHKSELQKATHVTSNIFPASTKKKHLF